MKKESRINTGLWVEEDTEKATNSFGTEATSGFYKKQWGTNK